MQTIHQSVDFEVDTCSCGGVYALPSNFIRQRRESHEAWNCPYCDRQRSFENSHENEILRNKVARLERSVERKQNSLDYANNRVRSLKGVITRTKKRIGKGVCPCCNRHFADVERHMQNKHPDYVENNV